jgi:hypothetical protein
MSTSPYEPTVRLRAPAPKAPARPGSGPTPVERRPQPWHSVSIVSPVTTCEAALQCRGKRYLSPEAPRLPLEECSRSEACRCIYRHHTDRRTGPRRASETGRAPMRTAPLQNLRLKRGRRKIDL